MQTFDFEAYSFNQQTFFKKKGVQLSRLSKEVKDLLPTIERAWAQIVKTTFVITSGQDGVHKNNSLHYSGFAIDIRTRDANPENVSLFVSYCRRLFSKSVQFVIESDHLHLEFDELH